MFIFNHMYHYWNHTSLLLYFSSVRSYCSRVQILSYYCLPTVQNCSILPPFLLWQGSGGIIQGSSAGAGPSRGQGSSQEQGPSQGQGSSAPILTKGHGPMKLLCPIDVCDCEKGLVEESFRTESECQAYLNCWATIPINERPFCQSVLNLGWVIRYHEQLVQPQEPKPTKEPPPPKEGLTYGLTVCLLEKAFEDSKGRWFWRDLGPDDLNCHF